MGERDNMAIGLLIIAILVFIIVIAILLYYTYSGQSGDTSTDDSCDYDVEITPDTNISNLVANLEAADVRLPVARRTRNNFNLFNMPNNNRKPVVRNETSNQNRINNLLNRGKPGNKVVTKLTKDTTISNNTENGKLFIINSMSPIEVRLPQIDSLTIKFWNNSTISQTISSLIPILDVSSGSCKFIIEPGQFLILESVGEMWLVIIKTPSGTNISPIGPCINNPLQECDMTNSIDTEINNLLNSKWDT